MSKKMHEEIVEYQPKRPSVINWMFSGSCNMKCKYCYGFFNRDDLTLHQKHQIAEAIGNAGVPKVALTGGEPLLGDGIYEIIDHLKNLQVFVSLHTNGLLLDHTILHDLVGKVGKISLPLDGSTNEMNSIMRGVDGYYDFIVDLMKHMKDLGIPFSIKTVATSKNMFDIPAMVDVLAKYQPDVWLISEFVPRRRGERMRTQFETTPGQFQLLSEQLLNVPFRVYLRSLDIRDEHVFFFIDSNGNVYTELSKENREVKIGSILQESIIDLWEKIKSYQPISEEYMRSVNIYKTSIDGC